MWEFNVTYEEGDVKYLSYVKDNLENCLVLSIFNNTLSVACSNENKVKVKKQLKSLLSEIIVLIYKEKFFITNLNLTMISKEYSEALIKCLVMFDYEDDIYYVFSKLELEYNLILSSFYNFKLKALKQKWSEIKNIASNSGVNYESETLIELIRFLIDSITPKRQAINIYYNGETFVLKDENNLIIKLNNALNKSNMEINLITTLISLAPKIINFHCLGCVSENTFKILSYLCIIKINLLV